MQVHYYLCVYVNSPTRQYEESSLKHWTIECGKDDLTFPKWMVLIENQGDATLIH